MKSKCSFHLGQWFAVRQASFALFFIALFGFSAGLQTTVHAQTFDSGSDGSDGALILITPGTIDFDPVALGLDADGDGIYNFTTITIGASTTVQLSARTVTRPLFWLASGDVVIEGVIDLNGGDGQNGDDILNQSRFPSIPGSGGYGGGVGGTPFSDPQPGNGPGGARITGSFGCNAGHAVTKDCQGVPPAAAAYGNGFLVPLVGGSGGSGGRTIFNEYSSGGGAGGGALLIASSATISLNGVVQANGGDGGGCSVPCNINLSGGAGSGGAIHLLASSVSIGGALSAKGGVHGSGVAPRGIGSEGRIRIEAFQRSITGSIDPPPIATVPTGTFFLQPPPLIRVTTVAGVPVPQNSTGSFTMPDVAINEPAQIPVEIEAQYIPLNAEVRLHLLSDSEPDQITDPPATLTGTVDSSTATVDVTIPAGFSRGFVRATWQP